MKFNGIDPCSLHPGISIAKEIPPGTVTSKLETLSGSTEEVIVGRTIKQAEYVVRINIAGKYRAQAWLIRKLLAGWARGTDVVTRELIPTHWPDVHYDAILKSIGDPEFAFGFGQIDVTFAIPRPIAVDNERSESAGGDSVILTFATVDEEPVVTADGESLQVIGGIAGYSENGSTHIVSVGGTSYARPTITAVCAGGNGLSVHIDGHKCFAITGELTSGEMVEISTNPPNVRIQSTSGVWSDANRRVDYTVTDYQGLAERFTQGNHAVACPDASSISVVWRDEWL